ANLEVLGALGPGRARVVRAEVLGWLEAASCGGPGVPAPAGAAGPFDLVLCDPPYAFDRWPELLGLLSACVPAGLVVAESASGIGIPAGWRVQRARSYGSTVVTLACQLDQTPSSTLRKGTD
ncbi:MAG: RsmD family RNA methyltransferase, partial [Acidimicrobiales bacterium]